MTRDIDSTASGNVGDLAGDRFEQHYRQQLSALVDGELAPDEARFLLRRLQHDDELGGRLERWQLCGDVLRGQVRRPAEPGLAGRVAAAIALEAQATAVQPARASAGRASWTRWSGGAALAASVAAVAIFVGRPDPAGPAASPAPTVAMQTLPATDAVLASAPATPRTADPAPAPAPAARVRPAAVQREAVPATAMARMTVDPGQVRAPAATREQVVAMASAQADTVATATAPVLVPEDPFASPAPLQARPWPRAVLAQPSAASFTASAPAAAQSPTFYPFEPRPPAVPVAAPASPDGAGLPAPPDDGPR